MLHDKQRAVEQRAVWGLVILVTILSLPVFLLQELARAKATAQRIACVNNLKQVGLAFRGWALGHQDKFPFNVPAKEGRTMEPGAETGDDFDPNPARVFQALSNELVNPAILVCPADASKHPALNFASLHDANVSYQVRTGTNVNDSNPHQVLIRCPIHGSVVCSDGSVEERRVVK